MCSVYISLVFIPWFLLVSEVEVTFLIYITIHKEGEFKENSFLGMRSELWDVLAKCCVMIVYFPY